ncbi:MAG: DUF1501 domain-containing protein [Bryobacterales bacterium]|nr:DUF1501 domain-containing protein [Bryobacterales bacterium]
MRSPLTRRQALQETAGGLGAVAASWLLQQDAMYASSGSRSQPTLVPREPHFAPKARSCIFIYMGGAPSTIDMFDYKPNLRKYDGKDSPFLIKGRRLGGSQEVMASPFEFKQYGETGRNISNLLPHFTKVVDEVAFIRSMWTDRIDHSTAQFTFASGRGVAGFPSLGSWASYGLGTENQNLPAFIAMEDSPTTIKRRAFGSAWLPPIHQGTLMNVENAPIPNLKRADGVSAEDQQDFLRIVNGLNKLHQRDYPLDADFESRIANFELAARMQLEASEVADISKESKATRELYGVDDPVSGPYGARCLTARRLVESGVRFVTVINGQWDHHSNIKEKIEELCKRTDQGVAGLLADLKARGLLEETLVVWAGEFGRLPTIEARQEKPGRDHNPYGFTIWMAGGGVRAGADYGDTDELGWQAIEDVKVSHHDVHATILHLLGLDVNKLTYEYEGRAETLTGVQQNRVVHEILAESKRVQNRI